MNDWKPRLRALERQARGLGLDRGMCPRCFPSRAHGLLVLDIGAEVPRCEECGGQVDKTGRALGGCFKVLRLVGGEKDLFVSIP